MRLQLCKNINLKIIGKVTGKQYIFSGAGSIVDVDDEDGEIMKMKMSNQPCCSGGLPTPYFQVVEDSPKPSTRSKSNDSRDRQSSRNAGSSGRPIP
jgi:hypothetical protein